jgi:hypothetical protein
MDVINIGGDEYYTLEFSTGMLAGELGRLRFYSSPDAEPLTVAADLVTPTSMAWDEWTGDIFVSEIDTGRIIRIEAL